MKMEEAVYDVEAEQITPPRKKLKQARLPFQVLSPDVGLDSVSSVNKRKLSEGAEDTKSAKIMKSGAPQLATETKENICVDASGTTNPKNAFKGFSLEEVTKATSVNLTLNANLDNIDLIVLSDSDDDPDPDGLCSSNVDVTETRTSEEPTALNTNVTSVGLQENQEPSLDEGKDSVEIILSTNDSGPKILDGKENGMEIIANGEDIVEVDNDMVKLNCGDETHPPPNGNSVLSVDGKENTLGEEIVTINGEGNTDCCSRPTADNIEHNCGHRPIENSSPKHNLTQTVSKTAFGKENQQRKNGITHGEDIMQGDAKNIEQTCEVTDHSTPQDNSIIAGKTPSQETNAITQSKRKLTPKQLQKRIESSKKKEEREKMKEEKEKKKQQKEELRKKEREQQRLEKEELKKKEREKQKQEKEDVKKKEKEEKERKRQAELNSKNEEKKLKEDERRKKELVEEEAKRKKEKAAAAFTSFFLNKKTDAKGICEVEPKSIETQNFMPFEVKGDMRLAPLVRRRLANKESMDMAVESQAATTLYLIELKKSCTKIKTSGRTWPLSELKDDVILLDDVDKSHSEGDNMIVESKSDVTRKLRAKLFLFHENRRPPYWGTWHKKSASIQPTRPFAKDDKVFDYDVDSDDEWEEEEPGESLHGSDDEKESVDDYEIDNDFFVPHGYLSDEENEGREERLSPETHKAKLKVLELEFEEEMKHKTERIKPRLLGCIWASNHEDIAGTQLMKLLQSRRVVYCNGPIEVSSVNSVSTPGSPSLLEEPTTIGSLPNGVKKVKLPDEAIPDLIRLTHGNTNSRMFLTKEFAAYWKNRDDKPCVVATQGEVISQSPNVALTKSSIADKIKEVAKWITCYESPMNGRKCWYVSQDIRSSYGLMDLTTPNKTWIYTMQPRRMREPLDADASPFSSSRTPKIPLITKFTKTMSPEERHKQMQSVAFGKLSSDCLLESSPKTSKSCLITNFTKVMSQEDRLKQCLQASKDVQGKVHSPTVQPPVAKKRVSILISVPRGQDIPKPTSSLMDHFKLQPNISTTHIIQNATSIVTESSIDVTQKPVTKDEAPQVDIDTIQIG